MQIANLPRNAIGRLPFPWSRDSQGQEMFLAPLLRPPSPYVCVYMISNVI